MTLRVRLSTCAPPCASFLPSSRRSKLNALAQAPASLDCSTRPGRHLLSLRDSASRALIHAPLGVRHLHSHSQTRHASFLPSGASGAYEHTCAKHHTSALPAASCVLRGPFGMVLSCFGRLVCLHEVLACAHVLTSPCWCLSSPAAFFRAVTVVLTRSPSRRRRRRRSSTSCQ